MVRLIMFSSLWIFPLMENTPKLFVKPGMEWGPWKSSFWTPSSFVPRWYNRDKTSDKQGAKHHTLQNRWLSCSFGINTVNQPPTTLVYSTCVDYPCVRIWKQLIPDMLAQSFHVCCFLFDKVDLIITFMMKTSVRWFSPVIDLFRHLYLYVFNKPPLNLS